MNREVHVRICEGVGVRFPHATRLWNKERKNFAACLLWTIIFCKGKLTDNQSWCEKLKPFKN